METQDFLYVMPDTMSDLNNPDSINCFTFFRNQNFMKFDYVQISDSDNFEYYWIAQVTSPNITVPLFKNSVIDPTILESISNNQNSLETFRNDALIHVYQLKLLKFYENEQERGLLSRPIAGSKAIKLSKEKIPQILDLPIKDQSICNVIGTYYHDEEIPICIDKDTFDRHIIVSGTTGSGKSNVNANLIKIAQNYGKAVIIHDAKPDFKNINEPNDEYKGKDRYWRIPALYDFIPSPMERVGHIKFYGMTNTNDTQLIIYMTPQSFTVQEFSDLFLFDPNDELANELFTDHLINYHADNSYSYIKKSFSLKRFKEITDLVRYKLSGQSDSWNEIIKKSKFTGDKDEVLSLAYANRATFKSMITKIFRRFEKFPWLQDTEFKPEEKKDIRYINNLDDFIKKILSKPKTQAPIIVFNYEGDHDGILYALMVRKVLKLIQNIRDQNPEYYEVVHLIDEAHRLFDSVSKQYKERLIEAFNKAIKEGRVKKHSIIVSLQNISEVPPQALNNLGTQIVLLQKSPIEGKAATATMDSNIGRQVYDLLPGNFLLKYANGKSTLNVNGFLSAMKLRRGD